MPLAKEIVDIPFVGGVDQKIKDQLIKQGDFVTLENALHDNTGAINKRSGFSSSLGGNDNLATAMTRQGGLGVYSSGAMEQLLRYDYSSMLAYVDAEDNWFPVGNFVPMRITREFTDKTQPSGIASGVYKSGLDIGYNSGYYWYAWSDSDFRCALVQEDTGIQTDIAATGGAINAHLKRATVSGGNYIGSVYSADSANIRWSYADVTSPYSISSVLVTNNMRTSAAANPGYLDAISYDSTYFFMAHVTAANQVEVNRVQLSNGANTLTQTEATDCVCHPAIVVNPSNGRVIVFGYDGANIWVRGWTYTGSALNSLFAKVNLAAVANVVAITGIFIGANFVRYFYEVDGGTVDTHDVYMDAISAVTGADQTQYPPTPIKSIGIASKPYYDSAQDRILLAATHESASAYVQQHTGFMLCSDNNSSSSYGSLFICGRFLAAQGGTVNSAATTQQFSSMVNPATDKLRFAYANTTEDPAGEAHTGFAAVTVELDTRCPTATLGASLYLASGHLYSYDSRDCIEHGFHLYPQRLASALGAGVIANGTYLYRVTYEHVNRHGEITRSVPSEPFTVTIAAGPNNVTLTVPCLRITEKSEVRIVAYRTTAGSSGPFYYVGSASNVISANTTTIVDNTTDANLVANVQLYTGSGEVLENEAPPEALYIEEFQNRLFVVSQDNELWFSKTYSEDEAISFSSAFRYVLPSAGGNICGIAPQDGQLYIIRERGMQRLYGEGPNDLGQGSFSDPPPQVPVDMPATLYAPIAKLEKGLVITGPRGIWLYTRDGGVSPIGERVKDYKANTVAEMLEVRDKHLLYVFYSDSTTHLVYDTYHDSWDTKILNGATGLSVANCVLYNGVPYILPTSTVAYVLYEDSTFNDKPGDPPAAVSYSMKATTGWLNLNGLQGYMRLYWIYVLGEYKAAHTLNVKLTYPDNTTETFTKAWTAADDPYEVRLKPSQRKTRRVKIEVWDSGQSGTEESMVLTGIRLEYGRKAKRVYKSGKTI